MNTSDTIRSHKILLTLTGLVGFFLFIVLYPLNLQAQEVTNTTTSESPKSQIDTSLETENRIQRVQQSIETKVATINYLKRALQIKSKSKRLSAPDLKILNVANENFLTQSLLLIQNQQDYLNYLKSNTQATDQSEVEIGTYKKTIYKSQQAVYYAFWETYNLIP